jgi:hypothetical protein
MQGAHGSVGSATDVWGASQVQSFGDSARERLETVEQKVFAIELRLQQQGSSPPCVLRSASRAA